MFGTALLGSSQLELMPVAKYLISREPGVCDDLSMCVVRTRSLGISRADFIVSVY